jgi:hypothetical protein
MLFLAALLSMSLQDFLSGLSIEKCEGKKLPGPSNRSFIKAVAINRYHCLLIPPYVLCGNEEGNE